jgi:hypothetical protein
MNSHEADRALDALLAGALAPAERSPDRRFVARVDRAIAEVERYRSARARLLRRLASEALAIGALAASLAVLARAPAVRQALVEAPSLAWPLLLSVLVLWVIVSRGRDTGLA